MVKAAVEEDDVDKDADLVLLPRPGNVGSSRAEFSTVVGFFGIVGGIKVPAKGSPVINGCSLA